ncbi:hypothetical protein MNKW57_29040 [Biformimicrobium ophioploci]|uniref:PilY1 beta-propeller domain-containing protein n=1 Tax=Biformimicrobium ophioploci TaxID=3036711 RepID=A0ABQ6M2M0_9GAMM|nr:hypothetical protein MNKW57_29040 [Microbulbifer sp. NKW57]
MDKLVVGIDGAGRARFTDPDNAQSAAVDSWLVWGDSLVDTGSKCFIADQLYTAVLFTDFSDYQGLATTSLYDAFYTGHFLNWYFSETTGVFSAGTTQKEGTSRRIDLAKEAASSVISSLDNFRIGVSKLDSETVGATNEAGTSDRARILQGLSDVATSGSNLKVAVEGIVASGNSPIGGALESIGNYFIEGGATRTLTLNPDTSSPTPASSDEVFALEPSYSDETSRPTSANQAIQKYCQQNFLVALTDGLPTNDSGVSALIADYDNDTESEEDPAGNTSVDDVAAALFDIDLRPVLGNGEGEDVRNNIRIYVVGFTDEGSSAESLLEATAVQGGSGGLFRVPDGAQLANAIESTIGSIGDRVSTASSVAFNSTSLETGAVMYSAEFDSSDWTGKLFARSIARNGYINTTPIWEAGEKLDDRYKSSEEPTVGSYRNRVVLTSNDGKGVEFSPTGIAGSPDGRAEDDLNFDDADPLMPDGFSTQRINYLRGSTVDELPNGKGFRKRESILGDIVHSTPVYVGQPSMDWPNQAPFPVADESYGFFSGVNESRLPVVYVGANDGMLHGFSAIDGEEVIAYVPEALYSDTQFEGLHALTFPNYAHNFYVDLTPTISDVYIDKTGGVTPAWMSMLVGGYRAGGKGYFALDITSPETFGTDNPADIVLWEFTEEDDLALLGGDTSSLGFSFSRARVALMNNGEWAVIFGNGYNSTKGDAALYILYIERGVEDGTWEAGDLVKISTNEGDSGNLNGLSSPALGDLDGDGDVDRIYAGDLFGNMWAFDVSSANDSDWDLAYGNSPLFKTGGEPITSAPILARNLEAQNGPLPNILVLFGTGQYLTVEDIVDTTARGFYAVWDAGRADLDSNDLALRRLTGSPVRSVEKSDQTLVDWTTQFGWKINLTGGERVVTDPSLRRRILFFNTAIPEEDECSSGGEGWLMSVDFNTGLAPDSYPVIDGTGDGTIDESDLGFVGVRVTSGIPAKSGFIGDRQFTPTSDGSVESREIQVQFASREGRLAWRELRPD